MNEFLSHALHPVILIYVVSAMLALGLGQTVKQIFEPLKNARMTVSAIVASYIILPLIATFFARLFGIEPVARYGLVLFAMAAGAEIGPLLSANSNGNARLSGGLLVLSIGITIFYLPLMVGVFLPDVQIDVKHLLLKLFLTILAPLILGLVINAILPKIAHATEKFMHLISRIFVSLLTLIVVLLFYKQIFGLLGSFTILAGLINVLGGFGVGYLLGWPERGNRLAMGWMHGARSASIAVMIAGDVFRNEPKVMLMIALMTVLVLVILLPLSFMLKIKPATEK